jgi:hypothetical protein
MVSRSAPRVQSPDEDRGKAKLLQDGVALGVTLGMTMKGADGPQWQFGDLVHAGVDPEAWFIFDLFERYGEMVGRSSRHAFEGFSREDWLMDLIAKLVEEQPTSLVPYADDAGHYTAGMRGKTKQPDDIGKWLTTVLYNALRNAVRDQKRHREILAEAILQSNHWTHVESHGESAESVVLRRESEREILARIKRLPRHLSQVAYLRYWGFPNQEIAWLLDVHVKTVEYRLRKIRSGPVRRALGL